MAACSLIGTLGQSFALELRRALFFEGARAFAGVFGGVHLLADLEVEGERVLLGQALGGDDGFLRSLWTATGPFACDLCRESRATARACPFGTTRPIRPKASASSAGYMSAVSSISIALV